MEKFEQIYQSTTDGIKWINCDKEFFDEINNLPTSVLTIYQVRTLYEDETEEEELNCAETILDGYATEFGLEQTSFDCIGDYIKTVVEAAQKHQMQEPIGEAYLCDRCQTPFDGAYECPSCGHHTSTKEPVYTAHHRRKTLTDEQIADIWQQYNPLNGIASFARAIEAAHGIKE